MNCPCQSQKPYQQCCEPYHLGYLPAPTPEALMRSRYSAFVLGLGEYLAATDSSGTTQDVQGLKAYSKRVRWLGLEVLESEENPETGGSVRFVASLLINGSVYRQGELSRFEKRDGKWFYAAGTPFEPEPPFVPGRNDPCPCGSGKKFKKCCGSGD